MRPLLVAIALFAVPQAAFAASASDAPISDSLPSRESVDRAGVAIDRMLEALMQIDIAPMKDAVDPGRPRAGRRETLGDLARRDDPYFDERVHGSIAALADGMGELSARMHRLEPALRHSLREIRRSVDEVTRGLPDDRDDD